VTQIFNPPTTFDNPSILPDTTGVPFLLFRHYNGRERGRSVVKISGVYTTVDYADQLVYEGLEESVDYFLGGHVYEVTDEIAAALIADGYGSDLTEPPVETEGTWAAMEQHTWGEVAGYQWGDTP
jgi:hypothetical protein